jgi:hypothetical protein
MHSCSIPHEYSPHPEIQCLRTILLTITHLRVDLSSWIIPAGFPTNSLCAFLLSPQWSARHIELICDLVNLVTFGEEF